MVSWLRHHNGWQVYFWNADNLPYPLINQKLFDAAPETDAKFLLLQYELLYIYGGVYLHCDFECFRNIEQHLEGRDIMLAREDEHIPGWIADTILAAVPRHPFIKAVIEHAPESYETHHRETMTHRLSTGFLSREYQRFEPKFPLVENPRVFFPFFPFRGEPPTQRFPETCAAHYYEGTWRDTPYDYQKVKP